MDQLILGQFAMGYWAAEANLVAEPDESQQGDTADQQGRLSRWAHSLRCRAGQGLSVLGTWQERGNLPGATRANSLGRSGC